MSDLSINVAKGPGQTDRRTNCVQSIMRPLSRDTVSKQLFLRVWLDSKTVSSSVQSTAYSQNDTFNLTRQQSRTIGLP